MGRYDSVTFTGQLRWQDRLNSLNLPFFLSSSSFFANYTVRYVSASDSRVIDNTPSGHLITQTSLPNIFSVLALPSLVVVS
jgi:endo-beta-N-acetylglucosaminidase D